MRIKGKPGLGKAKTGALRSHELSVLNAAFSLNGGISQHQARGWWSFEAVLFFFQHDGPWLSIRLGVLYISYSKYRFRI